MLDERSGGKRLGIDGYGCALGVKHGDKVLFYGINDALPTILEEKTLR